MNLKLLSKKFPEQDLEWRIQQCGKGANGAWALVVPYITNRAIMQRLDKVCGVDGWKNEYTASPCGTGYMCGISIKIGDEWVTRWDGSEITGGGSIDKVKSTLSTSMKRTGVQWGIGRYLYHFETGFATTKPVDFRGDVDTLNGFMYYENKKKGDKFQWKPPAVPAWALPVTEKEVKANIEAMANADNQEELRMLYENAYKIAEAEDDDEMLKRFVKAKDKAKEAFVAADEAAAKDNYAAIAKMVNDQISLINSATNHSALNGLTKSSIDLIKTIARGDNLTDAMREINSASYTKAEQLREGK
jgi:hypothetical protein